MRLTNPISPQVTVPVFRRAMFADVASVAKKGSAFKRCFHEPV
jgi:hypothetical protein